MVEVGITATFVVVWEIVVVGGANWTVRVTVWAGCVTVRTSVLVVAADVSVLVAAAELSVLVAACATALGTPGLADVPAPVDPQAPIRPARASPASSAAASLPALVTRQPGIWLMCADGRRTAGGRITRNG